MLTATYTLVAMATEQANACSLLGRARQTIEGLWSNVQEVDLVKIETALVGLTRFDQYCRQRKVEKYVIPAVRGASCEVDKVVGDLDGLSSSGQKLLSSATEQLRQRFERHTSRVQALCGAMDSYCECLQLRLRKEDEELFPLVRRLLSVDDWFALAAQFLGDEREHSERYHHTHTPSPAAYLSVTATVNGRNDSSPALS